MSSSILTYVDIDRKLAQLDAIERKEEILKERFGHTDFINTNFELKYDVSFAGIIEPSDGWKVEKFINLMYHPTTKRQDRENCITWLYNFFSKYYDDKKYGLNYDIFPKPIQLTKAFDRCVNVGLRRTAELITGTSQHYFTHYAWGEGTAKVLPKDTKLQFEITRVPFQSKGFAEPRGSEIAFFARTLENVPTAYINESGVFDSGNKSTSTMLLRTKYGGTSLQHIFQQDQVIIMTLVYQLSV